MSFRARGVKRGAEAAGLETSQALFSANIFALKFLLSQSEANCLFGEGGQIAVDIQAVTATTMTISSETALYPGTNLRELNITGSSVQTVLAAKVHCLTKMIEGLGKVDNGEPHGLGVTEGRAKLIVPTRAAASIIGPGGVSIKSLRNQTGCFVHVEKAPVGEGEIVEQVVAMTGPLTAECMQACLTALANHILALASEPWFVQWAQSTNAGRKVPGLILDFSGKGLKGIKAGHGDAPAGRIPGQGGQWNGPMGGGGGGGGGMPHRPPPAMAHAAMGGPPVMALKTLLSWEEAQSIGPNLQALMGATGCRMAMSEMPYPGTKLGELNIQGPTSQVVCAALIQCYRTVADQWGSVWSGEEFVQMGGACVKILLPQASITAVIGRGGAHIKELRTNSGMHARVEQWTVPEGGGNLSEQCVTLSGPLVGLETAVPALGDCAAMRMTEPWFSRWAWTSHCGLQVTGQSVDLSGSGLGGPLRDNGKGNFAAVVESPAGPYGGGGGSMPSRGPRGPISSELCIKMLLSDRECSCLIGLGGAHKKEIQDSTGARLTFSDKHLNYPGTLLQEVKFVGATSQAVITAMVLAIGRIVSECGTITSGEAHAAPGCGKLKIVVPARATATLDPAAIDEMQQDCNMMVQIEPTTIPPMGGGDLADQVICLSGPIGGAQAALIELSQHVSQVMSEPWFPQWSANSYCGAEIVGLQLDFASKGMHGVAGGQFARSGASAAGRFPQGVNDRNYNSKRQAERGNLCAKLLVSPKEACCILGPGGARIGEIQRSTMTKLTLTRKGEYFPGTELQEVNIQGSSFDAVVNAVTGCLGKILGDLGALTNGGSTARNEFGMALVRMVLPVAAGQSVVASTTGPPGEGLRKLREEHGVRVEMDPMIQPTPDSGDICEQICILTGAQMSINQAVSEIITHVANGLGEPWFPAWAGHCSCVSPANGRFR